MKIRASEPEPIKPRRKRRTQAEIKAAEERFHKSPMGRLLAAQNELANRLKKNVEGEK